MFKTLFRKNYSKIVQTVTKSESSFNYSDELLQALSQKDEFKQVHSALVKHFLTSKSQISRILTIRLWKWLLANGSFEFRSRLAQERNLITSTVRSWQDPIVENAFMQMIIDTAALFKNEPGLQHMLEFTPGPTSPTHLESLTRNANNDPSNPIFNSFARCSDAVMTLKQVQKHVDITMTACDMFVEALNFNEGPVSNNELVTILYQQLLTFKSANDRWIKKNNVSEDGMGMLLTCNDRILSAISLLQQMVKEGEIKSFPNLNQISVEESYFPDPSGVNSVDGQNPINNINHQPPHHFDLQKPLPQVNLKQPLEDDYRPLSLKNSREMGSGYIPPLDKDLIFGSHHLPNPGDNQSLEPDDVSMLESEDSVVNEITEQLERVSKVMDENNEVPLLPSQTVNNPLYVEDKVLDEVTEDLEDVKVVDENLGFNDGAVDDEVLDEITEKRINRIVPNQELNASNDSDEGQVVSNIQLKGESDHGEEVQHISILPPQQEDAQVESDQVSHAEEVQHMSILPPQQEDAQVGDNQHAIISKEDSVSGAVISDVKEELEDDKSALCLNLVDFPKEAVVSTPSQEAPPISSVREPDTVLSPPPDSTKPAFIKEAKLQNSKRYFFNHPPEAWTDLQDIKTTMSRAFEELTNAANLMESRHSDRSANVKVYIAKGRQIHDLAQFAIDHWEPRIKDCRNPMVKKDLFSSFQQMGAMRGVLAVLLKRKFSDVKEGDDGHLLSSCKDLKMIFDSAMGNLIAYELTKEQ